MRLGWILPVLVLLLFAGGCSLPGDNLDPSRRVFENRNGYVRAIEAYLDGKERAKIQYTSEELRSSSGGMRQHHGGLGSHRSGNNRYSTSGAILKRGYDEDFDPDKFSLRELHNIYRFINAVEEDPTFRKQLSGVLYLLRATGEVTVYGLKKDGSRGPFSLDYRRSEPGGAIVLENGRVRVLFCEPGYAKGASSYMATEHSIRAADLGTFHGHPAYPGPTARDIVINMRYRTDSFVIADRGDGDGRYRVNLNYLTDEGEGLDLGNVRLDKPDAADLDALQSGP